jgi:hypothetical protein
MKTTFLSIAVWAFYVLIFLGLTSGGCVYAQPTHNYDLDARKIMEAVNARYMRRMNEPRVVHIHTVSTISTPGVADITTTEDEDASLKGDKARVETKPGIVRRAGGNSYGTSRIWVHDGKETRILYENASAGGKTVVKAEKLRNGALPANLPIKYRAPLSRNEFDEVFLRAKFRADPQLYQGGFAYVLRSLEPIQANIDSVIVTCAFWVDPTEMELIKMEMVVQQAGTDEAGAGLVYESSVQEMKTDWGVPVPDSLFVLELPAGFEDITDKVANKAAKNLQQ